MPKKIVRDLNIAQNKRSFTVELKDAAASKKTSNNNGGTVNISDALTHKVIITPESQNNNHGRKEEYVFIKETEDRIKFQTKISELARMAAAGTLILFLINIVNVYNRGLQLKSNLIASASTGYNDLIKATHQVANSNLGGTNHSLDSALNNFNSALDQIYFLQTNQNIFFTKEKTVDAVNGLLDAAKNITLAGKDFARGIQDLKQLPKLIVDFNSNPDKSPLKNTSLTATLKNDLTFLDTAATEISQAATDLNNIDLSVLPEQYKSKLDSAKDYIKKIQDALAEAQNRMPAVLKMLGDRYQHRYLILLQNDTEARPTGGFIGSYIIADFNDGYLTKFDFHDVYDTDGQLKDEIPAPPDIASITKYWRLRDSNYSPDFAISAEKAAWFLQKEKGPSVDSVIAINQSFLADLLGITGPIQLDSLKSTLDASNYQLVLSYLIEAKISGDQSPKQVLKEFIDAFKEKLLNTQDFSKLLVTVLKGIENKKIFAYSRFSDVEDLFNQLNISGKVNKGDDPNKDYLLVTNTSVGGNKSDLYMSQSLKHQTTIDSYGFVTDKLSITRKHNWTITDGDMQLDTLSKFGFKNITDGLKDILGRGINKTIVKVYVPKGTRITALDGLDVTKITTGYDADLNKTYFTFKMELAPGMENTVNITYQLPFNLGLYPADSYGLIAQNASSINPSDFTKVLFVEPSLTIVKEYPDTFKPDDLGYINYSGKLDQNLYLSALISK